MKFKKAQNTCDWLFKVFKDSLKGAMEVGTDIYYKRRQSSPNGLKCVVGGGAGAVTATQAVIRIICQWQKQNSHMIYKYGGKLWSSSEEANGGERVEHWGGPREVTMIYALTWEKRAAARSFSQERQRCCLSLALSETSVLTGKRGFISAAVLEALGNVTDSCRCSPQARMTELSVLCNNVAWSVFFFVFFYQYW